MVDYLEVCTPKSHTHKRTDILLCTSVIPEILTRAYTRVQLKNPSHPQIQTVKINVHSTVTKTALKAPFKKFQGCIIAQCKVQKRLTERPTLIHIQRRTR